MERDDEFNPYLAERAFGGVADDGLRSPEAIELQQGNGGPDRLASVDESLLVSPILTDYVGMTGAKPQGRLCGGIEEEDDNCRADGNLNQVLLNDTSSIFSPSSFASTRETSDRLKTDQELGSDFNACTLKQMEDDPERSSLHVDMNNAKDPPLSAAKLLALDTSQCPSLGLGSVGSTDSVAGEQYDGKSSAGAQQDGGACRIENGVDVDETKGSIKVLSHSAAVDIDASRTANSERNIPESPTKGEEAEETTDQGASLLMHSASTPLNHDLLVSHDKAVEGKTDGSKLFMGGKKEDEGRSRESLRDIGIEESDDFDDPEVSFLIGVTGSGEEALSDIDPDDSDTIPIVVRESSETSFENDEECSEGLDDSPLVEKVAKPSSGADPLPKTNTPMDVILNGGVAIGVEIVADVEDSNCAHRAEVDGDHPLDTNKGSRSIDGVFHKEHKSNQKVDGVGSFHSDVVREPMQDRHEVELSPPGNHDRKRDSRHTSNKFGTPPSFPDNECTADERISTKEENNDFEVPVQADSMERFSSAGRKSFTANASEPRTQHPIDSNSAAVVFVNETQKMNSPVVPILSDHESLATRNTANGEICRTTPSDQDTSRGEGFPARPDPPSKRVPRSSNHEDSVTPEETHKVTTSALKNEFNSHEHDSPKGMLETPASNRNEAQDESVPVQSGSHVGSRNLLSLSSGDERSSRFNDNIRSQDKFSRNKAIAMNNGLNSEAIFPPGEVFPSPPNDQSVASPVRLQSSFQSGFLSESNSDRRQRNTIGFSVLSPPLESNVSKPVHDLSSARKKVDASSSALVERLRGAAERRKLLVSRSRNSLVAKEQERHNLLSDKPATSGDAEAEQSFELPPPVSERKIPSKSKRLAPAEDPYQPFKARPLPITTGEMGSGGQAGVPKVAKRVPTVPTSPILGLRRSSDIVSNNARFSTNKGRRSSNVPKRAERSGTSRHQDVRKPPSKTIPVVKENALRAKPFRRVLAGNEASQAKEMALREKRRQEEVEARKLASFRARPLPRASIKPPPASSPPLLGLDLLDDTGRKENKHPIASQTPADAVQKSTSTYRELHSTRRAKSRAYFDAQRALNEHDRSRRRHKQRKRLMLKTEAQLKELRNCLR